MEDFKIPSTASSLCFIGIYEMIFKEYDKCFAHFDKVDLILFILIMYLINIDYLFMVLL